MKFSVKSIIFLLLASVNILVAQNKLRGNKTVVTENRDLSNFTKIEIRGNIDVILTQSNGQSVVVETDENLQFAVLTEVKDNTLVVSLFKKITKKKVLYVYITVDEYVDEIVTKDKAKITSDGVFNFNTFEINAEGDSKISMDIKTDQFILNNNESANVNFTVSTEHASINANKKGKAKINVSSNTIELLTQGSSSIELLGNCKEILITTENKSNVRASKLECDAAIVNASDGSDVHVNSKESISVSAINSSEIYIYSNPEITIEKFTDKAILRKK